jgi:hypothetical protein
MLMRRLLLFVVGLLLVSIICYDLNAPPDSKEVQNMYELEYQKPAVKIENAIIRGTVPAVLKEPIYEYRVYSLNEILPLYESSPALVTNRKKVSVKNLGAYDDLNYGSYIRSNKEGNTNGHGVRRLSAQILLTKGLSLLPSNKA